jgi:hypothetical protein
VDPAAKPENKMMLITPIAFSGLRSPPSSERSRTNFPDRDFGISRLSYRQVLGSAARELAGYAHQELNHRTNSSTAAGKRIAIQESMPNQGQNVVDDLR